LGGGLCISSNEETRETLKDEYAEGTEKDLDSSSIVIQTRSSNKDFILFLPAYCHDFVYCFCKIIQQLFFFFIIDAIQKSFSILFLYPCDII
jgi:hypothetical protein